MERVLLVEDNREIAGMIFDFFEGSTLTIDYADNGELGLQLAQENNFDIILLDLMLPRIDGLTVCNMLREQGNETPILMLTALDSREDLLNGFEHGADDYLAKPFNLRELRARMRALIRRYRGTVAMGTISYGEVEIDLQAHKAYRQGKFLALTPTTFSILELLVKKAPHVVSKEEIIQRIWQDDEINMDVLRSHIYQLRNQLDKPFEKQILKTITKVGFCLEG